VDQVKQVAKWRCKICQEGQSLKRVYSSGSGADCRKVVQELNWKRMEVSTATDEVLESDFKEEEECQQTIELDLWKKDGKLNNANNEMVDEQEPLKTLTNLNTNCMGQPQSVSSRWTAFLPPAKKFYLEEEESDDPEEEAGNRRKKPRTYSNNLGFENDLSCADSMTRESFIAGNKDLRRNPTFSENNSSAELAKTRTEIKKKNTDLSSKPAFSRWDKFS